MSTLLPTYLAQMTPDMELTVVDISTYLTQRQVCRVLTEEALRLFHL